MCGFLGDAKCQKVLLDVFKEVPGGKRNGEHPVSALIKVFSAAHRELQNLHQLAAASRGFEQRQYIRHAEQFQNLLARIHHFQPAAPGPR
jgi:hypothetical protein